MITLQGAIEKKNSLRADFIFLGFRGGRNILIRGSAPKNLPTLRDFFPWGITDKRDRIYLIITKEKQVLALMPP